MAAWSYRSACRDARGFTPAVIFATLARRSGRGPGTLPLIVFEETRHGHRRPDHLRRLAHHRAARHLHRPHRRALQGSRPPARARRQARRSLRHRRPRQAHPDGPHRRRRQAGGGAHDVRGPLRGPAPRRLGPRGPPGRPGPRRRERGDPLSDRRHDALQPSRLRVQAGVLRRLQRLDRGVLRSAPRTAAGHRPDGDALGGSRHRGPRADQASRARSTSGYHSPSTSSPASRTRSRSAGPS